MKLVAWLVGCVPGEEMTLSRYSQILPAWKSHLRYLFVFTQIESSRKSAEKFLQTKIGIFLDV